MPTPIRPHPTRAHPPRPSSPTTSSATVALAPSALFVALAVALAVVLAAGSVMGTSGAGAQPVGPASTAPSTPSQQPAGAAPPAATPGANTWALSPSSSNPNEVSSRAFFSYELPPESDITDSATVWNYSDDERTFNVYARDAFNTEQGGFDVLTGAQAPTGAGSWIKLSREQVTVPARSGVPVPFTLTVPADAARGDHAAGIVASLATGGAPADAGGRKVVVDHRAGSRVYLRVPGPLTPALTIESMNLSYQGTGNPVGRGEADVTYTVKNTGNVRLRGSQQLKLTGLFGMTLEERALAELPDLLPGSTLTKTEHLTGVLPAIKLSADLTVTPMAVKDGARDAPPAEPSTRSTSAWAIPWTLLLGLVVLVIALWLVRRRRRQRGVADADRAAPTPGGSTTATAEGPIDVTDDADRSVADRFDDASPKPAASATARNNGGPTG